MKLAHLNPFLGGRGEWRDEKEGESVTETGRERRKKTNETMKEKKDRVWVQVRVQGQQRGIEMTGE